MSKIILAGLINIETTVACEQLPIQYTPIDYKFFGVETNISGVGYNIAKAFKILGDDVELYSIIGRDIYKAAIKEELKKINIDTSYLMDIIENTPQSVVLYDSEGKREIKLDLKNIQDSCYEFENLKSNIDEADIVIPCNINFARPLLKVAKEMGKTIASDVHVISDVNDEYNRDFMEYSDILFFSNENILGHEEEFIKEVADKYDNEIIVVGLGKEGALMYLKQDKKIEKYPAIETRNIVSTIGAGDALMASFIHFYANGFTPQESIKKAILFASYKIGEKGASNGFLSEEELLELDNKLDKGKY